VLQPLQRQRQGLDAAFGLSPLVLSGAAIVKGRDPHIETAAPIRSVNHLEAGRAALDRRDWPAARLAFEAALQAKEDPEALEGLGLSAWWLNLTDIVFDTRERAYRGYLSRGENVSAARVAIWIAWDCWALRAEAVVGRGWLGRLAGSSKTPPTVRNAPGSNCAKPPSACSRIVIPSAHKPTRTRACGSRVRARLHRPYLGPSAASSTRCTPVQVQRADSCSTSARLQRSRDCYSSLGASPPSERLLGRPCRKRRPLPGRRIDNRGGAVTPSAATEQLQS
jgi:hypothetical protein